MGWYRFFKCLAGVQNPISLAPKAFDRAALSNGPMPSNPAYRAINSVTVSPSLPRSRLSSSWRNFCAGRLGEITRLFLSSFKFQPAISKMPPGYNFQIVTWWSPAPLRCGCNLQMTGNGVWGLYYVFIVSLIVLFTFSYSHVNNWRQSLHCRKWLWLFI